MSLLENVSFKKKWSYNKIDDENKSLSFSVNIVCDHEIDKHIIESIEKVINDFTLDNYITQEKMKEKIKIEKDRSKEMERVKKENEKMLKAEEERYKKEKERMRRESEIKNEVEHRVQKFINTPRKGNIKIRKK